MWSKAKISEYNRAYRLANAERISIRRKLYYYSNWERIRKERKTAYAEDQILRRKVLDNSAKRRKEKPAECAAAIAKWQKANPARANAINKKHKAAKIRALPLWADLEKIQEFYSEAHRLTKETGVIHQVDHIVPLQSKLVSGLHVEANLRVIPKRENCSKQNRFWPNMP